MTELHPEIVEGTVHFINECTNLVRSLNQSPFLTDQEVAELLDISVEELHQRINDFKAVPPYIEVDDARAFLWPKAEVYEWIQRELIYSTRDD